jgi:hypothetical protein
VQGTQSFDLVRHVDFGLGNEEQLEEIINYYVALREKYVACKKNNRLWA